MSKQKTRFDGLDVLAMTSYLQNTILGYKVVNIYDGLSGKDVLLFKLASTGTANGNNLTSSDKASDKNDNNKYGSNKQMLLLESGIRFHLTSHESNSQQQPGQFAMKLRKHIRGSRLEGVRQLGNLDRVVDFRFGSGDRAHHIILELYASGNVILTDSKFEILGLLRTHNYEQQKGKSNATVDSDVRNDRVRVAVHEIYPVTFATSMSAIDEEKAETICDMDVKAFMQWIKQEIDTHEETIASRRQQPDVINKGKKKKKKSDGNVLTLKSLILKKSSGINYFGPALIEHCILRSKLDPNMMLSTSNPLDQSNMSNLLSILQNEAPLKLSTLENQVDSSSEKAGGYILYEPKEVTEEIKTSGPCNHSDKAFKNFQPHLLQQHQQNLIE